MEITKIKVCDAIMGSGKTQAAITYMNEHPEKRFIYITPFLDEVSRIKHACQDLRFREPERIDEFKRSKVVHTATLIDEGVNIATTHAAFLGYDDEMIENIKKHEYTLIIDEDMEIVDVQALTKGDYEYLIRHGLIEEHDGLITRTDKHSDAKAYDDILKFVNNRKVYVKEYGDEGEKAFLFYWTIPEALLTNFIEVYILTYLFEGQKLHHYLKLCGLPYENIGVCSCEEYTGYCFTNGAGEIPEYVKNIKDLIHIYEGPMNDIGEDYYALSASWLKRNQGKQVMLQLRNNMTNWFRNLNPESSASDRLWSTLKDMKEDLKGGGYTKGFLHYNTKASNNYRDRTVLSYSLNIFPHYTEQKFFQSMGVPLDRDVYATSTMVQWIWRAAIRDGRAISLYIPSRRMRELLYDWIESLGEGV